MRETCGSDGSHSSLTVGREIASATATCDGSACTANLPDTVELTLTSTIPDHGPAITYHLTASLRPQSQTAPSDDTSTAVPTIVAPASLTDWTVNRDYPGTPMIASAGMTPYAWSATGLPPGLAINSAGVVTGTPTTTGVFTPTITLTDAVGFTDTLTLPPLTIAKTPEITGPADLPDWTRGQDYPLQTMTWQDGTAPFTWAASGLPTGLDIDPVTGEITGTPTASLTFTASVTVTDSAGASATKIYTVKINPPPGIATAALPPAEVARPYNTTVAPTGGTPPLTWSLPPPKPPWLSINSTPPEGCSSEHHRWQASRT